MALAYFILVVLPMVGYTVWLSTKAIKHRAPGVCAARLRFNDFAYLNADNFTKKGLHYRRRAFRAFAATMGMMPLFLVFAILLDQLGFGHLL